MRRGITKSLRLSSTFAKRSSTSNIQKVNKNKSNYVRFYASSSSSAIEQSERSSEMLCTLVSPYETFLDGKKVERVNVVTELGERAFLADYVSFLGEIHPGVIEVLMREEGNESTKKYFASSGIVTFLNEANHCKISCSELVNLSDLDPEAAATGLTHWNSKYSEARDEDEKFIAQVGINLHTMLDALK